MKFICDVHISYKLVKHLNDLGFEAVHVNSVLNKWYTHDHEISAFADLHDLIIVTKDSDFKNSFFVKKSPRKLIKISLGNTSNQNLIKIISENIAAIQKLNTEERFLLEIDNEFILFVKENE